MPVKGPIAVGPQKRGGGGGGGTPRSGLSRGRIWSECGKGRNGRGFGPGTKEVNGFF